MGVFALQRLRDTASIFDHFQPALHIALRIVDHLAVLAREQLSKLLHVRFDQFLELEHHARALLRIGCSPIWLDFLCGRDGFVEQSGVAQRHFGLYFAGRRVPDLMRTA